MRIASALMLSCAFSLAAAAGEAATEWFSLGVRNHLARSGVGTIRFDLTAAGMASARYVMIADRGEGVSIDAVGSLRHAGSDQYADEVLGFFRGEGGDTGTIGGILGGPDYGSGAISYTKLGAGGWLILDMGAREEVVDGPGDDIEITCIGEGKIEVFVASGETQVELRRIDTETGGFGSLAIESSPGTVVYLDGKEIGEAPRWIDNLFPGSHEIELKNPHGSHTEKVNIDAGKTVRLTHKFMVEVPKGVGLAQKAAKEKLERVGFKVKVNHDTDIEQLFGRVLRQSHKPGDKLEAGTLVEIIVNKEARY